ncbi:MAG: hypothetical protein IIA90_04855, partial [Chloroflexi bacterium]|nr:hypothetical protein [Chloroflexota bacterium]
NVVEVSFESRSRAWGILPMNRIAISVEDPEGLIEALKPPASAEARPAAAKKPTRRSTRNNGSTTKRRTKRDTK